MYSMALAKATCPAPPSPKFLVTLSPGGLVARPASPPPRPGALTRSLARCAGIMAAAMSDKQQKEYREAFGLFDKDKDVYISSDELATVMRSLGHNPTPTEVRELISEGVPGQYTERGGRIDFNMFCNLMVCRLAPTVWQNIWRAALPDCRARGSRWRARVPSGIVPRPRPPWPGASPPLQHPSSPYTSLAHTLSLIRSFIQTPSSLTHANCATLR